MELERELKILPEQLSNAQIQSLIEQLGTDDDELRHSVINELAENREQVIDLLLKALENPNAEIRFYAILVLGKIGDRKAVEKLISCLEDSDSEVRNIAASALGSIGDSKAVEPLIKALSDNAASVVFNAAQALGKFNDPKIIAPLEEVLKNPQLTGHAWREVRRVIREVLDKKQKYNQKP